MQDFLMKLSKFVERDSILVSVVMGTMAHIFLARSALTKKGFVKGLVTLLVSTAITAYYVVPVFIEILGIESHLKIRAIYAFSPFYAGAIIYILMNFLPDAIRKKAQNLLDLEEVKK